MKYFIMVIFSIFMVSCAHHHNKPKHHHHSFEKKCAYSVAHGNLKIEGNSEYKLEHGGQIYYFSSIENMNDFKMNIKKNIKAANKHWSTRRDR